MNLIKISLIYIRRQSLNTLLNALLMALGVGGVVALVVVMDQVEGKLQKDAAGIDLVAGAKGSPAQLIMSAIFHIDAPTGNISAADAESISKNRFVKKAIPLALGDSAQGFRIIGTTAEYPAHYGANVAQGKLWAAPMEAVIGASVAKTTGLRPGASFTGSHGLTAGGEEHHDNPYKVTGVLSPTDSALDNLILTSVESVWKVHEAHGHHEEEAGDHHEAEHDHDEEGGEITALLIQYSTPMAAASFPRYVNSISSLQAASPAFETARIMTALGAGVQVMKGFSFALIFSAGLGVFIALYNAMKERKYDLAIMRALGASRRKLFLHVICEGFILTTIGVVAGIVAGHLAVAFLGAWLGETRQMAISWAYWSPKEFYLVPVAFVVGFSASLIPAIQAYSTDVANTLTDGGK
ncbi:MAG: ABC transporter permease [Nitrospinae bacterium]|nr:ABC transporter permease [Nitrospinota bacterium]